MEDIKEPGKGLTFGDKMRAARKSRHITQESLAKELGISLNAVGRYERGERDPQFLLACKIAGSLHVPLDCLVPDELVLDLGLWR